MLMWRFWYISKACFIILLIYQNLFFLFYFLLIYQIVYNWFFHNLLHCEILLMDSLSSISSMEEIILPDNAPSARWIPRSWFFAQRFPHWSRMHSVWVYGGHSLLQELDFLLPFSLSERIIICCCKVFFYIIIWVWSVMPLALLF